MGECRWLLIRPVRGRDKVHEFTHFPPAQCLFNQLYAVSSDVDYALLIKAADSLLKYSFTDLKLMLNIGRGAFVVKAAFPASRFEVLDDFFSG